MDYYSQLSRFLRRKICIEVSGRCTIYPSVIMQIGNERWN
jgi:hypothetical protein